MGKDNVILLSKGGKIIHAVLAYGDEPDFGEFMATIKKAGYETRSVPVEDTFDRLYEALDIDPEQVWGE